MSYLVNQSKSQPTSTAQVAVHYGFSEAHLSKVFQRLTKAGLVKSVRGPRGGFVLALDPASITLKNIYEAIDGTLSRKSYCLLGKPSCKFKECIFGDLMKSIHQKVEDHFSSTRLIDLITQ